MESEAYLRSIVIAMEKFEFKVEDYFNLSRSDGASKAFAGEVLCGCIHVEDSAVLNFGKYSFKLEILGCEKVLWQPGDILTPEDGLCGIATSVDDRDLLEKLLREKGWGILRGSVIKKVDHD